MGNLAGTVVHFAAFNAGVIALVRPLTLDHATTRLHLPAAAILAAILVVRRRVGRIEGAGLIAVYTAYLAAPITVSP